MPPDFETLTDAEVTKLRSLGWTDERLAALDSARVRQQQSLPPTGAMSLPPVATEQIEEQQQDRGSPVLAGINAALFNQLPRILSAVGQEEAAERVQESVERAFETQPGAAGLAAAGGMLLPSVGTIPLLARGARGAAGIMGRGVTRLAGGRAPAATELARRAAEAGTEAAVGAAGGAAEGALIGQGAAFGEPPEVQQEQALTGALTGGLLGGGAFGAAGALRAFTRFDDPFGRAVRIQRDIENRSGLPSRVESDAQRRELTSLRRQAFKEFEETTPTLPTEVTAMIEDDPAMRRLLRRVTRNSEQGRRISRALNERQQALQAAQQPRLLSERGVPIQQLLTPSEVPALPELPSTLVQNMEQEARRLSQAFAKGKTNVSRLQVDEAGEAAARLRDALSGSGPKFDEAIALSAKENAATDAFKLGEQAFGAAPDRARAVLTGEGRELRTGRQVRELRGPEQEELFRAGMASRLVDRIREGRSIQEITKALSAPAEQERLRIIFGSDKAVEGFLRTLRQERGKLRAGKIVENVIKFGGFLWLGSSLAGNTVLAGLGGPE